MAPGEGAREFIKAIHLIGLTQGFFLGMILMFKKENRGPNRIISALILCFSILLTSRYLMAGGFFNLLYWFTYILFPCEVAFGPLVYLYTISMTSGIDKLRKKEMFHLIPVVMSFAFIVAIRIVDPVQTNFTSPIEIFLAHKRYYFFIIGFSALSGTIYSILAWNILRQYTRNIKEFFSEIERLSLRWLRILIALLFATFISWNLIFVMANFNLIAPGSPHILKLLSSLFILIVIFITAFLAFTRPDIFKDTHLMAGEMRKSPKEEKPGDREGPKYEKQSIDELTGKRYLKLLKEHMETKKPYLNESITLKDLADRLSIPSHHLSIVINLYTNRNFYNFINEYRINEVKERLSDPQSRNTNILNIAFESGFNSKSAFNTIFKRVTGLTPTQYRKDIS